MGTSRSGGFGRLNYLSGHLAAASNPVRQPQPFLAFGESLHAR
jgi:hypothetical protein